MRENILLVWKTKKRCGWPWADRLRREGYVVDSAADGESAFEKVTSLPFDLMILDIMLDNWLRAEQEITEKKALSRLRLLSSHHAIHAKNDE